MFVKECGGGIHPNTETCRRSRNGAAEKRPGSTDGALRASPQQSHGTNKRGMASSCKPLNPKPQTLNPKPKP